MIYSVRSFHSVPDSRREFVQAHPCLWKWGVNGAPFLRQGRRSYQPLLVRSDKKFLAVGDAEFIEDAGEVMPDCNAGDAQAIGNILIGEAFTD